MTETFAPGAPSWVDLGTTNIVQAERFYDTLFGWTHQDFGPEMGDYGMFFKDGKQVAGVGPVMDPDRGSSWATYFSVDDADEAAARVESAGGSVVAAPLDVMDQGRMAVFTDPSGAFFSVWQPGTHKGAELTGEPGSVCWTELESTDIAEAKPFYENVLGVDVRDVDMGGGETYSVIQAKGRPVAGAMQSDALPAWRVYFAVDDTDASYAKALELGASPDMAPQDSPPGRCATLFDPSGARFSIIKPNPDFRA
jgi:predicted enzyme related to lactoylglutathione lyase